MITKLNSLSLLAILIFTNTLCFGQNSDQYKSFKTGTFTYLNSESKVKIVRSENEQVEIYNDGESRLILDIHWENDSTYVLTLKQAINAPGCLQIGDWIKTTITSAEKSRYTCTYTSNRCGSGESEFIKLK